MSIATRIRSIYAAATANLKDSGTWLHSALGGGGTASGQHVTPDIALTQSAVLACCNVLSTSIGQIKFELMKRTKDGDAIPAVDHPLYPLLMYSPNGEQTAQELKELDMMALCLRGTSYRQIVRAGGVIQEINYLHPDRVKVQRDANGQLEYVYTRADGTPVTLKKDDVWRTMGLSLDGVQGISPITYMREAIGFALAAEEQGASLYRNGMQISTVIQHPGTMTETAYKNLKKSMDDRVGSKNAGKSFVLEEGAKIEKLSMSAVDAQYLETRKFQVEEIARAYGVPSYKINHYDGMTFNNVAQLSLDWITSGVMPWAHKFEQTAARDLLLPSERKKYFLRADPTVLLRGDNTARAAYYQSAILTGWFTRAEARKNEGLPRIEGLDEPLSPLNMGKGSQLQGTNDGKDTSGFTKITMSAQADSADVYIYEQIGEGWFGGLGAKAFVDQLNALGPVATLNVHINSPGGDVFEGNAIYNALKQHSAKVIVSIDSIAASAASLIAMAGDEVTIAETAMLMIHNPRVMMYGEASDLRSEAELLDKIAGTMGIAYARSGKPADEITLIMDAETWYTAQEAVDAGFADSIIESTKTAKASVRFAPTAFAAYKNTPKSLLSEEKPAEIEPIAAENAVKEPENKPDFSARYKYLAESLRLAELQ